VSLLPNECPKCGSGLMWPITDGYAYYKCHSFMINEGGFGPSADCTTLAKITGPLLKQFNQLRVEVEQITRERDETRNEFDLMQSQLDEARASLKQALQERDYERERADGNWKYCRQYEDERNKAEAEIGRIKNLLEHVKADRELIRNAGLQADKERDEAQLLNQELKTELNHALVELHQARAEVAQLRDTAAAYEQATVNQQLTVRADPSRLEIAAMIYSNLRGTSIARAMVAADELIAAAREGK
jgi:hypothetical protein